MYGTGLAKGLMLTLRHFFESYVDDLRYGLRKYHHSTDNFGVRQGTGCQGRYHGAVSGRKNCRTGTLSLCAFPDCGGR